MAHANRNTTKLTSAEFQEPSSPCDSVQRRMNSYILAASAAGVAMLACSLPAEGSPVCLQVGFTLQGTDTYALNPVFGPIAPFNIAQTFSSPSTHPNDAFGRLFLTPNFPRAEIVIAKNNSPADLPAGSSVGPGAQFGPGKSYGLLFSTNPVSHGGNLQPGKINYFGYRFLISGKTHYGWVRMTATIKYLGYIETQVVAFGYESAPDTPIAAGKCDAVWQSSDGSTSAASTTSATLRPASLGTLALGAQGLPLWRK